MSKTSRWHKINSDQAETINKIKQLMNQWVTHKRPLLGGFMEDDLAGSECAA